MVIGWVGAKDQSRFGMNEADSRQSERLEGSGRKRVGIREVAKEAGVSVASVSRTLNKPSTVSTVVRQRVLAAIERLAYVPNSAARSLSLQRTQSIGAIVPTLDYSIFARFIEAMQIKALQSGYSVVLSTCGFGPDNLDRELEQARVLIGHGIEALVVSGEQHRPELYQLLQARNIPYVHTSIYNPDSPHPCVGYDNRGAAFKATEYLLSLGHQRLGALVGLRASNDRMVMRVEGVRKALSGRGLALPEERIVERPFSIGPAREGFRELFRRDPGITAFICGNDVLAFGVLLEAQSMGLRVPQDVSIVGFDNLEWAAEIVPALTTIQVPTRDMGSAVAQYLIGELSAIPVARHTKIDVSLILRDSTGPVPGR